MHCWSEQDDVCKKKDEMLSTEEQEVAAKDNALSDAMQQVTSPTDEGVTLKSKLKQLTVSHINDASQ